MPTSASSRVLKGLGDLAGQYDVILSDVWGVLHDGRAAFPEAVGALRRFRERGGCVVLITNAPRPRGAVVRQLDQLGVTGDAYDALVTSGDATIALIEARGTAPLHHIGPPRDVALFDELRDITGLAPPRVGLEEAAHVVCTGLFDDARETPDHYGPTLERMRALGLEMICANPDVVVHIGDRVIFCGGAIAERYEEMGGVVHYAGKPHPPIYGVALAAAGRRLGRAPATRRVLTIGDALRTDIMGAARQGLDALFIASGIHSRQVTDAAGTIERDALDRLFAEADVRPVGTLGHLVW